MRAADYAFFDVPFAAFAHRGGATYEPNLYRENSLHAFKEAVALGYRYLETDVHATRDGVLLAFNDRVLDRVTDHTGAIAELTYAEIAEARIHGLDPIPRLSELLAEFPDVRFNVDVKFVKKTRTVGLDELRGHPQLKNMQVLRRGNRLSIMPVTQAEWECVMALLERKGVTREK